MNTWTQYWLDPSPLEPRVVLAENITVAEHDLEKSRKWFKQINGRLAQICAKIKGPGIIITNALAPHTWANGGKSRETAYEIRQEYFQLFTETLLEQKQGNYHIVVGDMNTRLHARLLRETIILGPHVFDRGGEFLKNMPQFDAAINRIFKKYIRSASFNLAC